MMRLGMVESDLETTPARSYDVSTMQLPSITWQDVQQMPDDGNRYEAIKGNLYMTAAPAVRHQLVVQRLYDALRPLLSEPGLGFLFGVPVGVEFPGTEDGVQPDLLFVANERRGIIATAGVVGAPDIVVEVLSPSTAGRDRTIKLRLYEEQGVRQYWIVDPNENAVDVWGFAGGERTRERFTGRLPVRLGSEQVGTINLDIVFSPDF